MPHLQGEPAQSGHASQRPKARYLSIGQIPKPSLSGAVAPDGLLCTSSSCTSRTTTAYYPTCSIDPPFVRGIFHQPLPITRPTGPYVMGALSTATGSFNGPMWFVAGCILIAGTLVALFPLKWGPHNDAPIIQARTASSLQLRQLSRQLTASRCAAASHYVSGSRRASIIGMLPSAIMVQPEGSDCQRGSKPSVISGRKGSVGGQGSVRGATVDGQLPYVRQTTAQEGTVEPQQPQGPDSV